MLARAIELYEHLNDPQGYDHLIIQIQNFLTHINDPRPGAQFMANRAISDILHAAKAMIKRGKSSCNVTLVDAAIDCYNDIRTLEGSLECMLHNKLIHDQND